MDFSELEKMLTEVISPGELSAVLEEIEFDYAIHLLRDDNVESKEAGAKGLYYLHHLRKALQKAG
ncbi:hypothetical protein [uncultured Mucilaginibacter sp.]|uniref:hypothetical protein n=1 Tax=uncultured Mucilaginibacter sp. TaxID=797541 RepID=UPI0025D0CDEE|nr:hypothetical protein [uncultured Mucilaginibacter sp.]